MDSRRQHKEEIGTSIKSLEGTVTIDYFIEKDKPIKFNIKVDEVNNGDLKFTKDQVEYIAEQTVGILQLFEGISSSKDTFFDTLREELKSYLDNNSTSVLDSLDPDTEANVITLISLSNAITLKRKEKNYSCGSDSFYSSDGEPSNQNI